jgi:PAS domain S-box-containing protein
LLDSKDAHAVLGREAMLGSKYFREVLEALPAAIYTTDAAGRITYYNEAAAAFWGCRPELGKSEWCGSWKLFWPDGTPLPHDQCPMAIALKEKRPVRGLEAVAERPDGTRVPFIPYPTPFNDALGTLIGAVNMLVEITDRKQGEQTAHRLASIVESSDDAIVSKDLNGVIVSWNRGAERLFGYVADEVIGKSVAILIPQDRMNEEPGILERIRRGERIEHYETVRRRKDGSLVEISLTVSPLIDSRGKIIGASKIARDITERKRAQAQQALLLNEMKHRVKNTLATVQAIATQTLRSVSSDERGSFAARIHALASAHDLLTLERWNRASLREVVSEVLRPFQESHRERFLIEGTEEIFLDASHSLTMAMALHELATNAVKYGALSNRSGRVSVTWNVINGRPSNRLKLRWKERGGPAITPPKRKGFGSRLIERAFGGEANAADFAFHAQGLTCTLELTL